MIWMLAVIPLLPCVEPAYRVAGEYAELDVGSQLGKNGGP
jgi:hypothetical protein